MPEPLFTNDDRPAGGPTPLPSELQGKSAEEVARYYQDLLNRQRNQPPATPPPTPAPVQVTRENFDADPVAATTTLVAEAIRNATSTLESQYAASNAAMQRNMIQTAEMLVRQKLGSQKDAKGVLLLDRFKEEIERYMAAFPGWQKADPLSWETAFRYVVGTHMEELNAETRAAALSVGEPVGGAPEAPPAPVVLTPDQERVARNLDLTSDRYREGISQLGANKWPITFSNSK